MEFVTKFFAQLYNPIGLFFARRQVHAIQKYRQEINRRVEDSLVGATHELYLVERVVICLEWALVYLNQYKYAQVNDELHVCYKTCKCIDCPELGDYIDFLMCKMASEQYDVVKQRLNLLTQ